MKTRPQKDRSTRITSEPDPSGVAYRERLDDRLARTPEDIYWMLFRKPEADHAKGLHELRTQTEPDRL
jgi:hypothetical protein